MLIGEYHHTLDGKGRVAVPARVRASCETGAVLTRGLDRSLVLFPAEAWQGFLGHLQGLPWEKPETRALLRLFVAGASDVELDRSGRLLIPEHLRAYARLERDLVFLGLGNRLEVWDRAAWQASLQAAEAQADLMAAALARPV